MFDLLQVARTLRSVPLLITQLLQYSLPFAFRPLLLRYGVICARKARRCTTLTSAGISADALNLSSMTACAEFSDCESQICNQVNIPIASSPGKSNGSGRRGHVSMTNQRAREELSENAESSYVVETFSRPRGTYTTFPVTRRACRDLLDQINNRHISIEAKGKGALDFTARAWLRRGASNNPRAWNATREHTMNEGRSVI